MSRDVSELPFRRAVGSTARGFETERADPAGHHVRLDAAVKRYGRTTALAGVDLEVEPGRFLVLLGRSGSGKSTIARVLGGVERLDGGALHLGGQLVEDRMRHLPPERRDLAMVFQDYALWPHLSAHGNVAYALRRRRLSAAETRMRAHEALDRVGLARLADRYPHQLSGGEQQRVALARAVVARPRLLLFDEPLSNLDADLREHLRVEIATLARECGATSVYITHDQAEAFALADEIAVMDSGRLVQVAPPEQVYHRPASPFVARFTGLAGELAGLVLAVSQSQAHVRVGDWVVPGQALGVRAGDAARVLIRPAATRLLPPQPTGSEGTLPGTVVDVAYRGRGYDHVVATPVGSLSAVFDGQPHPRGALVHLQVRPEGALVYPEEESRASRSSSGGDASKLTAVTLDTDAVAYRP